METRRAHQEATADPAAAGQSSRATGRTRFRPELIEATTLVSDGRAVDVYKVGGGFLGGRYAGRWGWRIRSATKPLGSGEDFRTLRPVDHDEVASLVLDHFSVRPR